MKEFLQTIAQSFVAQNLLGYFLRIAVATLCGVLIGLERTKRSKEAGVRTHCIIACASALIMVISKYGFADMIDAAGNALAGTRGVDPSRIAAQVVSGISFLGAGVIFKNGTTVKGLTTAAGIWATAGVGLACGAGMYAVAIIVSVLIIGVQLLMHRFSIGNDAYFNGEIRITMVDTPQILAEHEMLRVNYIYDKLDGMGVDYVTYYTAGEDGPFTLDLSFETDFYDPNHINYFGAVKFTDALAAYIDANYGLPDRRNDPVVRQHWGGVYEKITATIEEYIAIRAAKNAAKAAGNGNN